MCKIQFKNIEEYEKKEKETSRTSSQFAQVSSQSRRNKALEYISVMPYKYEDGVIVPASSQSEIDYYEKLLVHF